MKKMLIIFSCIATLILLFGCSTYESVKFPLLNEMQEVEMSLEEINDLVSIETLESKLREPMSFSMKISSKYSETFMSLIKIDASLTIRSQGFIDLNHESNDFEIYSNNTLEIIKTETRLDKKRFVKTDKVDGTFDLYYYNLALYTHMKIDTLKGKYRQSNEATFDMIMSFRSTPNLIIDNFVNAGLLKEDIFPLLDLLEMLSVHETRDGYMIYIDVTSQKIRDHMHKYIDPTNLETIQSVTKREIAMNQLLQSFSGVDLAIAIEVIDGKFESMSIKYVTSNLNDLSIVIKLNMDAVMPEFPSDLEDYKLEDNLNIPF